MQLESCEYDAHTNTQTLLDAEKETDPATLNLETFTTGSGGDS